MKQRQQFSTLYPITFLMVDSTDHVTGKSGLTPTVTISKNGGAFAPSSGAVSEIGNGWYALAGNATDRETLGDLLIHATGTGADPVDDRYCVVPWDPFDAVRLGLTAMPPAAAGAAGGMPVLDANLAAAANVTYWAGAPVAGAPALEATAQAVLEDTSTTLPALIAGIEGGGSYAGDGTGYYSDTIDDGTNPLDGVRVQLYTAPNRVGPAYEAYTNALGVFVMHPDPGTYYRWLDLAGFSFTQDVAVVVTE